MSTPFFSINFNRVDMELFLVKMAREFDASPEQIDKAKITALNYVSTKWYNEGLKLVKSHFALKDPARRYKESVHMDKASKKRPYLVFRAEGRSSLHLSDFKTKATKKGGVSAQVLKGGKMTPFQKIVAHNGGVRTYRSFRIKGSHSGKTLIATRDPERAALSGREGLRVFYGPGLIPFLNRPENREYLLTSTFERFQKRFEHDLNAIMNGWMQATKKR